jgi:hypothetical protein
MVKHLPRKRCNIVMPGKPSTAYRDAVPGSEVLPQVEHKPASRQARQWQPARFVLNSVGENASHPGNA